MPSRHVPSSVASPLLLKQKTLSECYARKRSFTKKEKEEKTHFFFSSFFLSLFPFLLPYYRDFSQRLTINTSIALRSIYLVLACAHAISIDVATVPQGNAAVGC